MTEQIIFISGSCDYLLLRAIEMFLITDS